MPIDAQRLTILENSPPADSPKGARTDWFLIVPARRGGGDIVAAVDAAEGELPEDLIIDLAPETGGRRYATPVVESGRTVWRWRAPKDVQVCRLLVKNGRPDGRAVPDRFAIEQHVEETAADERIIFRIEGSGYRSNLFQLIKYDQTPDEQILVVNETGARFAPSDPRDHLVTRFIWLQPGVYELRLHWPAGSDISQAQVKTQLRDYEWLPTVSTVAQSEHEVRLTAQFEVPDGGLDVRFHFFRQDRAGDLPARIDLARLLSRARIEARLKAEPKLRWLAERANERELIPLLETMPEETVLRTLSDDPWLLNYTRNIWEWLHGRSVLTTYPTDICVPIADVCNARCTFCTSWLEGTRIASMEEIDAFEPVFRFSRWVGLAGHGEPLAHPHIGEILSRLGAWLDQRAEGYVITNGVYLPRLLDDLTRSRIKSFALSLNAATAATHREVMGLPEGSFERILQSIRRIVAQRDSHESRVSVSMVITKQNMAEIPAFVELANEMRVDKIQLKTLAPVGNVIKGLNYHLLPPYDHPDYASLKANAVAAITASTVPVQVDTDSWDVPVFPAKVERHLKSETIRVIPREEALANRTVRDSYRLEPKYQARTSGRLMEEVMDYDGANPFGRVPPFQCRAPYRNLYINDFSFNLSPCCYLPLVPGSEPAIYGSADSFMETWNSEAFVALRRRLHEGPLFNMCTKCPGTY